MPQKKLWIHLSSLNQFQASVLHALFFISPENVKKKFWRFQGVHEVWIFGLESVKASEKRIPQPVLGQWSTFIPPGNVAEPQFF